MPKTQRINELTLEAVEGSKYFLFLIWIYFYFYSALCRVDLLIEQILRIDPKSRIIPTSTSLLIRPSDIDIRQSTSSLIKPQPQQQLPIFNGRLNGQPTMPVPVLRTQQQTLSGRYTQEKTSFKPVIIQQQQPPLNISENTSRPSSVHPQNHSHYFGTEGYPFVSLLVPHNNQPIQTSWGIFLIRLR